ncbi:MAG: dethiobiotin synthase [Deferribacterales bacterium]
MKKLYITGTDTGIGKTYFSGLLCRYLKDRGESVYYIKPVQTGFPADDDRKTVLEMSGIGEENSATLHTAEIPTAPYLAFDDFPYEETVDSIKSVKGYDWLVVESAGGILVPLDEGLFNCDIALACGLKNIVVVPNRLGCVNHAMLSRYFIRNEGMDFGGFAMNNYFMSARNDAFNISMLNDLTDGAVRFVFSDVMEFADI